MTTTSEHATTPLPAGPTAAPATAPTTAFAAAPAAPAPARRMTAAGRTRRGLGRPGLPGLRQQSHG
ncbi:hypothetical protein BJ972_002736 [Agromyces atrinae]|uniref:Uncharacterized protein n=1 Tax=Agromyces atrinae TaxID=592376 RepID=A0A852SLP3_9MICO|nr:hypothetical protein [Agromyces atrinae]